jgi:MscS family membrane protein
MLSQIQSWLELNSEVSDSLVKFATRFGVFVLMVFVSVILANFVPPLLKSLTKRFLPEKVAKIYLNLTENIEKSLRVIITLLLFYIALNITKEYEQLYNYLKLGIDLAITFSYSFFISGLFRNFLRIYGVILIRKIGLEIEDMFSILETIVNIFIGIVAVLGFAQSQNINLIGVIAGLGIGGLAVAFAAQSTLEQILGTVVIYLDRPYSIGEYIRIHLSSQGVLLAKVESIGLRSTKLRTLAKSTLVVVPNSTMASSDIENVTRGKKIMVLLYFDFNHSLNKTEEAVFKNVIKEGTNSILGMDSNSIRIKFSTEEKGQKNRAQISFFVIGSHGNSQDFRRELLILTDETISKKLVDYGMEFTMKEPTVYVESSVTI